MSIHIHSLGGDFDLPVGSSETVLDLKMKIHEDQGIDPSRQNLYFMSYLINDDDAVVEELKRVGGNTLTIAMPTAGSITARKLKRVGGNTLPIALPTAGGMAARKITTNKEVFLINGDRHNFQSLLIKPNREMKVKLKTEKFGIVYHVEGTEIGKRLYHVEVFGVKEVGSIELRNEGKDGRVKPVLIRDNDGTEEELEGVIKAYDESKSKQEASPDKAVKVSEVVSNLGKFIEVIGGLVFGDTKTSSDEVLSNPNDRSMGYHSFYCDLICSDPNASQYSTENINFDSLSKKWKYILRSLLPEDAEKMIHSIQEVFGIEDIAHKMLTTFSVLKKALVSGELDNSQLQNKLYPILEKVKNTSHEELFQVNTASSHIFNEYSIDEVILTHYSTLIKKLLPSLAIPIIGALNKLYETDEKKAIATEHILNRYSMMKYTSLEAIEEVRDSILQYESGSKNNFAFASIYKPVYDVIIIKSLPESLKDREAFKDEVMTALNSIKTNGRLREWLIQVHDQRCFSYGWQKIEGSLTEDDFQSVSFEILDVFYGNEVHFSFKFLGFDIEEQNQNENFRSRLEKLNNLYRIALEKIDDILPNSTSIKVENNIITIAIMSENEANVETILLDQFRDIWGKAVSHDSYRQELLSKLNEKFPHISYNTTENILELFKNETYRDMDGLKLQIRNTRSTNSVTLIDGYVLWPKETRRLSELPNEWFTTLYYSLIVKFIPQNFHETIGRTFILNSSLYKEADSNLSLMDEAMSFLSEKVDVLYKILGHFRRNGGTVGDLRLALKECMTDDVNLTPELNHEKLTHVQELITKIDIFIDETYEKWKSSFETKFPGVIIPRKKFEQFFKHYGLSQIPKMKVSEFNRRLENEEINNCDQIWLWRFGSLTDSYAHVGIYVDEETIAASELVRDSHPPQKSVVHVTARNRITWKYVTNNETGKISCNLIRDVVHANDEVFVVRYREGDEFSGEEIAKRALACCRPKISFYYNGYFASCETFASKVCGSTSIRDLNLQGFRVACQGGKKKIIADRLHRETASDDLIQKIDARMMEMTG